MNNVNLKKNDIVVISVIFLLFCIFILVNVYLTNKEHFLETKQNKIQSEIKEFISYFRTYVIKMKEINVFSKELLNNKASLNLSDELLPSYFDNIRRILSEINKLDYKKKSNGVTHKKTIHDYFYTIFNGNKEIIEIYRNIFQPNVNSISSNYNVCGKEIVKSQINKIHFIKNMRNSSNGWSVVKSLSKEKAKNIINTINLLISFIKSMLLKKDVENTFIIILEDFKLIITKLYIDETNILVLVNAIFTCNTSELDRLLKNIYIYEQHYSDLERLINKLEYDLTKLTKKLKVNIFIHEEKPNFFDKTRKNFDIETKFCKKLKLLDKPNKNNLIFNRFSKDIIDKKKKYLEILEKKMTGLLKSMTDKEIKDYNQYRLRTHKQAELQYNAIKKGIDNIKNRNKLKINMS